MIMTRTTKFKVRACREILGGRQDTMHAKHDGSAI